MNELIQEWLDAKRLEREAVERRRLLDKKIAALLPAKTEGTSSAHMDGYKVAVEYKVTRKVDSDVLASVWNQLTPNEQKLFRWKAELSMKEFRDYSGGDWLNQIVTSKAGSPTVTIEEEDGNQANDD